MQKISKSKAKNIGKDGKIIYSLALQKNQKTLYAGVNTKNIKIYDISKNKLLG
jgi:hypothetical protein